MSEFKAEKYKTVILDGRKLGFICELADKLVSQDSEQWSLAVVGGLVGVNF